MARGGKFCYERRGSETELNDGVPGKAMLVRDREASSSNGNTSFNNRPGMDARQWVTWATAELPSIGNLNSAHSTNILTSNHVLPEAWEAAPSKQTEVAQLQHTPLDLTQAETEMSLRT